MTRKPQTSRQWDPFEAGPLPGWNAGFQVIKFGGIVICHRTLRAPVSELQLCGWQ